MVSENSSIYKRISVRRFTEQDVTAEEVTELLRAAMNAPSAHDRQPWRFLVIRDKEQREFIAKNINTASFARFSPVLILVIGNMDEARGVAFVQDCSAATENMLIRAAELELGACWIGVAHMPDRVDLLQKRFGISFPYCPFGIVAVGHPGREYMRLDKFDSSKVFFETFDIRSRFSQD